MDISAEIDSGSGVFPPSNLKDVVNAEDVAADDEVAKETADAGNLSRQGIMDAARNINDESSLLLDGLVYSMDANDAYISEGTQIREWDGAGFVPFGEVRSSSARRRSRCTR